MNKQDIPVSAPHRALHEGLGEGLRDGLVADTASSRSTSSRRGEVLTASELAALCEVDLKTIHNWVEQGRLLHFRTPGRHLRFRAPDVASFLTTFGYDVPRKLARASTKTGLVVGSRDVMAWVSRSLGEGMRVHSVAHALDALILAGLEAPDVFFVDVDLVASEVPLERFLEALKRACPQSRIVPLSAESMASATKADVPPVVAGELQ